MADQRPTIGSRRRAPGNQNIVSASGNVVPFRRPVDPPTYDPGTPPFDRANPAHVEAWNAICALGRSALS